MKRRNKKVLDSFVKYCKEHPTERFWQALRNWSKNSFVSVSDDSQIGDKICYRDTFYWEGRDK